MVAQHPLPPVKKLSLEGEAEHKGAGVDEVDRHGIEVVVLDFEVGDAEAHLELDGEFHIAQIKVEAQARRVANIAGIEPDDGLVVVVLVVAERCEVETVAASDGEVGSEVAVAEGPEFKVKRNLAIDRLHAAFGVGSVMLDDVLVGPVVVESAVDECKARQKTEVEVVAELEVGDDGEVEPRGVVGACALEHGAHGVVEGVGVLEFGLCVAELYAVVYFLLVETGEIVHLGKNGHSCCHEKQQRQRFV